MAGHLRRELEAGEIIPVTLAQVGPGQHTAVDAGSERVRALENHLATIRALRQKYFGGAS